MRSVKKKKLSQVLHVVDPNLNIVSPHKKRSRTTKAEWEKLDWFKQNERPEVVFLLADNPERIKIAVA